MQIVKLILPVVFALAALTVFIQTAGSESVRGIQIFTLIVAGFGLGVAYSQLWYNIRDKRRTRRPMA